MGLTLYGVGFLVVFGLGVLAALWWMGRVPPPATVHVPPAPIPPPVAPIAPPVAHVRVRFLDTHGHVVGMRDLDRRFRRPEMAFHGAIFHAERESAPDVWDYRWMRSH